jgi:hypothetical protein
VEHDELVREIRVATGRGDRRCAARQLLEGCQSSVLTSGDLKELIPDVWLRLDGPAGPGGALTTAEWVEIFRRANFFVQGPPIEFGDGPVELFRAAPRERARGMSWCTELRMAERFVRADDRWGRYELWSAAVPTEAILAALFRPDDGVFESPIGFAREIIVDPSRLSEPVPIIGPSS